MDRVHGLVHGPGPWGGPWTPVHVLYTSVSGAKGLSVHVCQFGIEGSVRVWPGTSFGHIFKRKLASKIT